MSGAGGCLGHGDQAGTSGICSGMGQWRGTTVADEGMSPAQSPGQKGEQGLARDGAACQGWEAPGELCAARDAPALQQGVPNPLRIAAG